MLLWDIWLLENHNLICNYVVSFPHLGCVREDSTYSHFPKHRDLVEVRE